MLAYLALHPRQAQSREKLAAMFWGGTAESDARTNLRQTLSSLRRALAGGNGARLLTESDHVALDPKGLVLDVMQFEELVGQATTDSLEQALALYKGDLLDGFSLKEEAFEEWVAAERVRLRMRAIEALERLVADYRKAQDLGRCLQAAVRLLMLDPLREDIHREVMRVHAAQGRLSSAVKQYEICRDILWRELGVQPEPETQKLFHELRLRRENSVEPAVSANTRMREAATLEHAGADPAAPTMKPSLMVARGLPIPGKPSVAVLPFDNNSGDPDQAYFANGITENIITGLTRFRDLLVISFTSAWLARDRLRDVEEIGRQLGVAHIVEGSVRRAGNRVRVTAQLVDAATGHRVWAERFDRNLDDVFAVEDEITDVIVATLAGRIEEASRQRSAQKPARDLAAYDYLLRARECMRRYTKQDECAARSYLRQAILLDPNYASAYAALALSHIHEYESSWSEDPRSAIGRALELAQKAVALDETESVAHGVLAYAAHYRDEHDFAKKEIDRATALNPNDYYNLCVKTWILNFSGHPEEGLVCRDLSLRLNPFAPDSCLLAIGVAEYTMRQYDHSAETFGQMSSWDLLRYACLAACHAQRGQDTEARAAAARALESLRAEFAGETVDAVGRWLVYVRRMFRFRKPDDWKHLLEGFRKAGLPV
jgi:TolB-like protein/DNA-binding SARP family transcriptional activator